VRRGRPGWAEPIKPLQLLRVLADYDIRHAQVRAAIRYPDGRPLSPTAFSFLINRGEWPLTINMATAKASAEAFLVEAGVPQASLQGLWMPAEPPVSTTAATDQKPTRAQRAAANAIPTEPTLELPEHEMLSAEARSQFRLTRNPFVHDVNGPDDVFLSGDQRYVRDSMYQAAKHGGFVAIVGESGSGKSTLRRDLIERVHRDNEPIIPISPETKDKTMLTTAHICHAIVATLSQESLKISHEAQARQIQRILEGSMRSGNSHVLVIEEAHDLSVTTLKYLKRFWEIEFGFRKLLGIVLIGQPELADLLDERKNYAAREVIRRCEVARLAPLNGQLEAYLKHKFTRVGVDVDTVFEADAYDAIRQRLTITRANKHVESHVYPLVVQNLCARAMNQAVDLGFAKVNAELIRRI
jgi:type II secretory pathway predicted ATPase ExeA